MKDCWFPIVVAELRKSAINNRKSSINDDHGRYQLSTGIEEGLNMDAQDRQDWWGRH